MASKKKPKKLRDVYQIKISLRGIRPPIWRRLEVFSDTTLEKLHLIFQLAMGWANYHLHQFTIGGEEYGQPEPDYDFEVNDGMILEIIGSTRFWLKRYCRWKRESVIQIAPKVKGPVLPKMLVEFGVIWTFLKLSRTLTIQSMRICWNG
jgi:hypothetical protein